MILTVREAQPDVYALTFSKLQARFVNDKVKERILKYSILQKLMSLDVIPSTAEMDMIGTSRSLQGRNNICTVTRALSKRKHRYKRAI